MRSPGVARVALWCRWVVSKVAAGIGERNGVCVRGVDHQDAGASIRRPPKIKISSTCPITGAGLTFLYCPPREE